MGFLKFVLIAAILGGAGHYAWGAYQRHVVMAQQVTESGFVHSATVDGASANVVLIFAPPDCPSEQARDARELADRLTQMGIPFRMGDTMSFTPSAYPSNEEIAGMDRAVEVFKEGAPAVFIGDMAKHNPTAEEVAFEFKRARAGR